MYKNKKELEVTGVCNKKNRKKISVHELKEIIN